MGVHLRGLLLSLMRGHILISCREKVVSGIMFRSPQSVGCTVHPALVLGGAHTVLLLGVLGRKVLGRSCSAPAETLSVNSRLSVRSTVCLSSLFCLVGSLSCLLSLVNSQLSVSSLLSVSSKVSVSSLFFVVRSL